MIVFILAHEFSPNDDWEAAPPLYVGLKIVQMGTDSKPELAASILRTWMSININIAQ